MPHSCSHQRLTTTTRRSVGAAGTTRAFCRAPHHGRGPCPPDLLQRYGPRRGLVDDRLPARLIVPDQRDRLVVRNPTDERPRPVANHRFGRRATPEPDQRAFAWCGGDWETGSHRHPMPNMDCWLLAGRERRAVQSVLLSKELNCGQPCGDQTAGNSAEDDIGTQRPQSRSRCKCCCVRCSMAVA
jgi:hypothetical protein